MRQVTLTWVLLLALITGCGVTPQERLTPLVIARPSEATPPAPVESGALTVEVYFARGDDLEPVTRSAAEASPQTALDLLVAGPTRREVNSGVRTALAPQPLIAMPAETGPPGTAVVAASTEFTSVSGGNQLLEVAQVVFTLTELPGIEQVSVTVDGVPVEVPTDEGLTRQPVTRADYSSVDPMRRAS